MVSLILHHHTYLVSVAGLQALDNLCKPLTAKEQELRDSLEQIVARLQQSMGRLQEAQPIMRLQVR